MKGYVFAFKAFVKKYWDEALVYLASLVGVYYALLKMGEVAGDKFHPSQEAIISAVVISMAATWLIENWDIKWGKPPVDVATSIKGRKRKLVPRLAFAWFAGAVGQVALPQLIDAGVKMVLGLFSAFGGAV